MTPTYDAVRTSERCGRVESRRLNDRLSEDARNGGARNKDDNESVLLVDSINSLQPTADILPFFLLFNVITEQIPPNLPSSASYLFSSLNHHLSGSIPPLQHKSSPTVSSTSVTTHLHYTYHCSAPLVRQSAIRYNVLLGRQGFPVNDQSTRLTVRSAYYLHGASSRCL